MKNILLLLSFFLMFLLGAESVEGNVPSAEGMGVESVFQEDNPAGCIMPIVAEFPEEGEACVDVESLPGQYRICVRGQRPFSVQQVSLGKSSAYRIVRKHLEMLYHTVNSVYTSLPCQSWSVSSEHYIFGMRRILI